MNAICEKFVYIHPIRSGGTWVVEILHQLGIVKLYRRYSSELHHGNFIRHTGNSVCWPQLAKTMPRFTFIRDPFSWYVSYSAAPKTRKDSMHDVVKENVLARKYSAWVKTEIDHSQAQGPFTVYPFNRLREGLKEYLDRFGYDGSIALTYPVKNASTHGVASEYFDDEMIDRINAETNDWLAKFFSQEVIAAMRNEAM